MADFFKAVATGDLAQVTSFVEQGEDKNQVGGSDRSWEKTTPLAIAAKYGRLGIIRYLVEQGADIEKACRFNCTPIILASQYGHLEVVRYLQEQGASLKKTNIMGETSLHYAASRGHLEIAKLLMVCGADLNARDVRGKLPIDVARFEKIRQAIRAEHNRRKEEAEGKVDDEDQNCIASLFGAVESGNLARVKQLVEQGEDKNQADENDKTALSAAAEKGYLDITRYLVEQGADMEKGDCGGNTPLIFASIEGEVEVAQYLLEQGANIEHVSQNNELECEGHIRRITDPICDHLGGKTGHPRRARTPPGPTTPQEMHRGRPTPHRSCISFRTTGGGWRPEKW